MNFNQCNGNAIIQVEVRILKTYDAKKTEKCQDVNDDRCLPRVHHSLHIGYVVIRDILHVIEGFLALTLISFQ